jgi:hypothetical protein
VVSRAEFVHSINRERRRDRSRNDRGVQEESEEDEEADGLDDTAGYSNESRAIPQRSPRPTSPRSSQHKLYPDEQHTLSPPGRNRKAFFDAQGNALVVPGGRSHQDHDVSVAVDATEYYRSPPPRAADAAPIYTPPSVSHNIPYASPVFVMDPHAHLEPPEFWQLWKQTETTYVQHRRYD